MSNETKNKTAADTVAENLQAIAEAVKDNAPSAEEIAQAAATIGAAPAKPGKSESKPKSKAKAEATADASALRAVGVEACKRHQLTQAWVTSDGQVFPQEGDAREHAKNLPSKETLKVTAK